jgi:hypothetical protein
MAVRGFSCELVVVASLSVVVAIALAADGGVANIAIGFLREK